MPHSSRDGVTLIALLLLISWASTATAQPAPLWSINFDDCGTATSVVQTAGSDFVIAANALPDGDAPPAICLYKVDIAGGLVWKRRYTPADTATTFSAASLATRSDGSVIVAGSISTSASSSDPSGLLMRVDKNGDIQWLRALVQGVQLQSVKVESSGVIMLTGFTPDSYGPGNDGFIARVDAEGFVSWSKFVQRDGDNAGFIHDLIPVDSGEAIAAGYSCETRHGQIMGDEYLVTAQTTIDGEIAWFQTLATGYAAFGCSLLPSKAVIAPADTNYIIASTRRFEPQPEVNSYRIYLVNMNSNGQMVSDTTYSMFNQTGITGDTTSVTAITPLPGSSDLIISGYAVGYDNGIRHKDGFLARIDAAGNLAGKKFVGDAGTDERIYDLVATRDGRYVVAGGQGTCSNQGCDSVYVALLKRNYTPVEKNLPAPDRFKLKQNYPNPFNAGTTISYELARGGPVQLNVYDMLGREVATLINESQSQGKHTVSFKAEGLSTGLYLYRLETERGFQTRRMLLVK